MVASRTHKSPTRAQENNAQTNMKRSSRGTKRSLDSEDTSSGSTERQDFESRMDAIEQGNHEFQQEMRSRMANLEAMVEKCFAFVQQRMGAIEGVVGQLSTQPHQEPSYTPFFESPIDQFEKLHHEAPVALYPALAPEIPPNSSEGVQDPSAIIPLLELSPLCTKWYTKRPYDDWRVTLRHPITRAVFTATPDWSIKIRVISGHGLYMDHVVQGAEDLVYPIVNGVAEISGMKFGAVTSRNGGHFLFEVSVHEPSDSFVQAVRSTPLVILSERLKNEAKADSYDELKPEDSVNRVPGIGKKYAARFKDAKIETVRDLAEVTPTKMKDLVDFVRKDRGALTEEKLNDLWQQIKVVVERLDRGEPAPVPKPTKTLQTQNLVRDTPARPPKVPRLTKKLSAVSDLGKMDESDFDHEFDMFINPLGVSLADYND